MCAKRTKKNFGQIKEVWPMKFMCLGYTMVTLRSETLLYINTSQAVVLYWMESEAKTYNVNGFNTAKPRYTAPAYNKISQWCIQIIIPKKYFHNHFFIGNKKKSLQSIIFSSPFNCAVVRFHCTSKNASHPTSNFRLMSDCSAHFAFRFCAGRRKC